MWLSTAYSKTSEDHLDSWVLNEMWISTAVDDTSCGWPVIHGPHLHKLLLADILAKLIGIGTFSNQIRTIPPRGRELFSLASVCFSHTLRGIRDLRANSATKQLRSVVHQGDDWWPFRLKDAFSMFKCLCQSCCKSREHLQEIGYKKPGYACLILFATRKLLCQVLEGVRWFAGTAVCKLACCSSDGVPVKLWKYLKVSRSFAFTVHR